MCDYQNVKQQAKVFQRRVILSIVDQGSAVLDENQVPDLHRVTISSWLLFTGLVILTAVIYTQQPATVTSQKLSNTPQDGATCILKETAKDANFSFVLPQASFSTQFFRNEHAKRSTKTISALGSAGGVGMSSHLGKQATGQGDAAPHLQSGIPDLISVTCEAEWFTVSEISSTVLDISDSTGTPASFDIIITSRTTAQLRNAVTQSVLTTLSFNFSFACTGVYKSEETGSFTGPIQDSDIRYPVPAPLPAAQFSTSELNPFVSLCFVSETQDSGRVSLALSIFLTGVSVIPLMVKLFFRIIVPAESGNGDGTNEKQGSVVPSVLPMASRKGGLTDPDEDDDGDAHNGAAQADDTLRQPDEDTIAQSSSHVVPITTDD